jgi:AcrR family transcriptional regulator
MNCASRRVEKAERIGMEEHDTTARARRAYRSPIRQRQAEEHRRSILVSARELFTQRGYAGTTLEAIAETAGVSPKTVVARFGSKRGILAEVLDPAGLGSRHAAVLERMRAAPDPRAKLALVARLTRDVYTAGVTDFDLLRGAGSVAPELTEVSATVERRRRQQQARLIGLLRQQGALRADRTAEEATDELWALTSFDLYRLLVLQSGWTPEHYELWLGETLAERLLAR